MDPSFKPPNIYVKLRHLAYDLVTEKSLVGWPGFKYDMLETAHAFFEVRSQIIDACISHRENEIKDNGYPSVAQRSEIIKHLESLREINKYFCKEMPHAEVHLPAKRCVIDRLEEDQIFTMIAYKDYISAFLTYDRIYSRMLVCTKDSAMSHEDFHMASAIKEIYGR
jgi:hypothetical protein